jgi:SAM-dependent methyltransferase
MDNMTLPPAASITHLHLLSTINTKLSSRSDLEIIKICDVGCGDGVFLSYLASCLPVLNPNKKFIFYGLDVSDSGVQAEGFFDKTINALNLIHPYVEWKNHLFLIKGNEEWPFPDNCFDIISSNQVLEHVSDHQRFMGQVHRTLNKAGVSIHLFPLIHYIWEEHIDMPLVHRISQYNLLKSYIKLCSLLGIGSYGAHKRDYGMTVDWYSEEHADYMSFMTNYLSSKEILRICKNSKLRADFSYTPEFYATKIRQIFKLPQKYLYSDGSPFLEAFLTFFLKRVSSITLCLEKTNIYSR